MACGYDIMNIKAIRRKDVQEDGAIL